VLERLDACVRRRRLSNRSELIRLLIEREVADLGRPSGKVHSRRLRRLRRCVSCTAFVRNGYTCKTCRVFPGDTLVIDGRKVPSPTLPRHPMPLRPDLRDPRWAEAEAVVLDAYAPIVGMVYERLTGADSFEMTDLDDVADLLAMAGSLPD